MAKTYLVTVRQTFRIQVEVDAANEQEAIAKAKPLAEKIKPEALPESWTAERQPKGKS
jgi:hypothetical protein